MRLTARVMASILLIAAQALAARLSQMAKQAFETYVETVEARLPDHHARGGTNIATANRVEPINGGTWDVNGGLLHHWRASAFVPGASPEELLVILRDYDHLASYYAPDVVTSHSMVDDGDSAAVAIRFRKHKIVTVVLDTEFEVQSGLTGNDRGYSYSRSTHVWQIDQAGTAHERRRVEGEDDGFLWRLNSYWSFLRMNGGLLMECEAVSLTRDVPRGLGWLITPVIQNLPRASLEFTMKSTTKALAARAVKETH